MGSFPKGTGQKQFLVMAVDYVTKWVEARPLARIREKEMIEFFMELIIFRFRHSTNRGYRQWDPVYRSRLREYPKGA